MSLVAEFSVPTDAFCLEDTLAAVPSASVELDRLVAHSPDYVMPFLWVLDADRDAFEAALADDPTAETATITDSFDDADLYQVTWADIVSNRLAAILDHEGIVLEARGTSEEWYFRVRFGSRDHFTEFENYFQQFGEITLHQLTAPQTPCGVTYGVSPKQREALLAAYDAGYYANPSETTGESVAEDLGISQQSLSRRLRRGVTTLIENTIARHRDD